MEIDIPFGAKDSELKGWKYTIPEGYTAEIKDGEIIVKSTESEDEMTRKHIIEILESLSPCHWNGNEKSKCIAYLEKQKEQKPKNILTNDDSLQTAYLKGQTDVLEDPEAYGLQKEQNPVEWSKATINGEPIPTENQSVDIPLAEWSEEDEKMLEEIINHIYATSIKRIPSRPGSDIGKSWIKWLKSLRPQPHKEIYQAAKHDLAIKFMNYLDENRPEDKMGLSNIECEDIDKAFKENDWVKIMRYVEKYHPHWKPSEEQMRVFFKATPVNLMPEELLIYQSLYNDIEKLM